MKYILLEDVKGLGKAGELVNAKTGYARNFLLPNKLALEGTKENLAKWKEEQAAMKARKEKETAEAEALKVKLDQTEVVLRVKTGTGGRLFGSITSQDISEALQKMGFDVDKKKIELKQPIKETGTVTVPVRVYPEIVANVRVTMQAE